MSALIKRYHEQFSAPNDIWDWRCPRLDEKRVLVLGAGVTGLTTALLLRRCGAKVEIHASEVPGRPGTGLASSKVASDKAGAFFFTENDPNKYLRYFGSEESHPELLQFSRKVFKGTALKRYKNGVDFGDLRALAGIREIPNTLRYLKGDIPGSYPEPPEGFVGIDRLEASYRVDVPTYLQWLWLKIARCLDQRDAKMTFRQQTFATRDEVIKIAKGQGDKAVRDKDGRPLRFDCIVNCLGSDAFILHDGARAAPRVRGQTVTLRKEAYPDLDEIRFSYSETDPSNCRLTYVMPRSTDILLGSTYQENDHDGHSREEDTTEILRRCAEIMKDPYDKDVKALRGFVCGSPRVGFWSIWPDSQLRLGYEPYSVPHIIHNYGHGRAGYMMSWGCAFETCWLVKKLLP